MPAARPRRSRSCTFFTVNRTASHAVLAPEAAIASAVITVPGRCGPGCSIPGCPPLHPAAAAKPSDATQLRRKRSEEHTSELQSQSNLVCRLLLEKKKKRDKRASPQER